MGKQDVQHSDPTSVAENCTNRWTVCLELDAPWFLDVDAFGWERTWIEPVDFSRHSRSFCDRIALSRILRCFLDQLGSTFLHHRPSKSRPILHRRLPRRNSLFLSFRIPPDGKGRVSQSNRGGSFDRSGWDRVRTSHRSRHHSTFVVGSPTSIDAMADSQVRKTAQRELVDGTRREKTRVRLRDVHGGHPKDRTNDG